MQIDNSKYQQPKKRKSRTWAEAAKIVLEKHAQTPMSFKAILQAIRDDNLKDISGSVPLACLNSCLHVYSRGKDSMFYKVAGRSGVYGLMSDRPLGSTLLEVPEDNEDDGDVRDKPFKERRKENVMMVTLPPWIKTIPPSDDDDQSNGDLEVDVDDSVKKSSIKSVIMTNSATAHSQTSRVPSGITSHVNNTLRRSIRQSMRQKKRLNEYPRIIIKPIPPPSDKEKETEKRKEKESKEIKSIKDSESEKESDSGTNNLLNGDSKSDTSDSSKSGPFVKKHKTMREILAGIPGFSMKPRRRPHKKLSHAAQIAQTKEGCIDLETPDSILVKTNLRNLIDKRTFYKLPANYQYKLLHYLPECDRYKGPENSLRLSSTALNNEFFNKACQEWIERLSEGEFTPENQIRLKQEDVKEQSRLDPWKARHFEPVWGKRSMEYEVPDTEVPSPEQPSASKPKPSVKKPTLVSTLLKQRSVSQTVSGSSFHVVSDPNSLSSPGGGLLLKVAKQPISHVDNTDSDDTYKTLKRSHRKVWLGLPQSV